MGDLIDARVRWIAIAAVASGLTLLLGLELIEEPETNVVDLLLEVVDILPTVLTAVGVVLLFRVSRRQHEDHVRLIRELEMARTMGERWRSEARTYLDGLGAAIDTQFTRWGLTEAEREVALLLLKGLSHKEVAAVRSTSERTVREQARALYGKAGLTGRAALSAFFLEDLIVPIDRFEPVDP